MISQVEKRRWCQPVGRACSRPRSSKDRLSEKLCGWLYLDHREIHGQRWGWGRMQGPDCGMPVIPGEAEALKECRASTFSSFWNPFTTQEVSSSLQNIPCLTSYCGPHPLSCSQNIASTGFCPLVYEHIPGCLENLSFILQPFHLVPLS
jgi:hypothetical protein